MPAPGSMRELGAGPGREAVIERPEDIPPDEGTPAGGPPAEDEDDLQEEAEADNSLAPGSMPPPDEERAS